MVKAEGKTALLKWRERGLISLGQELFKEIQSLSIMSMEDEKFLSIGYRSEI